MDGGVSARDAGPEDTRPADRGVGAGAEAASAGGDGRVPGVRRVLDVVLLVGPICVLTAAAVPGLGGALLVAAWSRNAGAVLLVLLLAFVVLTLVIAVAARPGRVLVSRGETWTSRLRWATGVAVLGTVLVAVGAVAWRHDPGPFGSAAARMWMVGGAYGLAAASLSRLRVLRNGAVGVLAVGVALALIPAAVSAAHSQPTGAMARPTPAVEQAQPIPASLLLVGDTPAGYQPVAGSVSEETNGPTPFVGTYTCVSNCPPGETATIMFEAAPGGTSSMYSSYKDFCSQWVRQGYSCGSLGPDMWRAVLPSSSTVFQVVVYEHAGDEFTLQAPPTMSPQLLRAYMLSIHPASNAELVALLRGYPNYN